jgi:nucleoside-diphosphate-sugar epimerase
VAELGESEAANGEVFNIGNPREISIRGLAELIIQMTGSRSPLQSFDPPTEKATGCSLTLVHQPSNILSVRFRNSSEKSSMRAPISLMRCPK